LKRRTRGASLAQRAAPAPSRSEARPISEERAEILRLITRLRSKDRPGSRPPVPQATASASRRAALPISAPAASPWLERGAPSSELSDLRARIDDVFESVVPTLHALEARLHRIEERLETSSGGGAASGSAPERYLLGGELRETILPDVIQLISSNTLTGIFVVQSAKTSARIYFDEGGICHAESEELSGEAAVFRAFGLRGGRFHFVEADAPPPARTIQANTQFLILEALRQLDEEAAG